MSQTPSGPTAGASDTAAAGSAAFAKLHPGVQKQLWRMGWTHLRPLQVDAIGAILESSDHVILSAATAAGKTEAAFLPILSLLADEPTGSVRALYVGPLKALINDQFRRIEELCVYLDIPVYRWHGDVPASHKAALVKHPAGVLLITPESLESLFVNRSQHLVNLFGGLRFVVVDEVHTFLDNERGLHLRSLLSRVRSITTESSDKHQSYRVAGLSATIGDFTVAQQFIDPDQPAAVRLLTEHAPKEIKYRIYGYRFPAVPGVVDDGSPEQAAVIAQMRDSPEGFPVADPVSEERRGVAGDIVQHCVGNANLVFANSKADVEEFADLAKQVAGEQRLDMEILVHHGSLSAEIREGAEATMKSGRPATTFCSATLELGIDIGSVKSVGQIGPAWSVSSMKQRLGRSGRHEGEPSIMRVYIECQEPDAKDGLFDRLHLGLVQGVALTELMLEHWVEPPRAPLYDLSTLTQQIISVICETGGLPAQALYDRLCRRGVFREIEPILFETLLRNLGARDIVEQTASGELILGLRGEKVRQSKSFYAVFQTPEEFSIFYEEQLLGTLEVLPRAEDHLLFAGRRWKVIEVNTDRREVRVVPAKGLRRPRFSGAGGEVNPMVRQKMKAVLADTKRYSYLDEEAASLLEDARAEGRRASLYDQTFIPLGPQRSAFMTWTGSRIQETLMAILSYQGVTGIDRGIALEFRTDAEGARSLLTQALRAKADHVEVARFLPFRQRRRYDWLFIDELLDISNALGYLDLKGAMGVLASAAQGGTPSVQT
jgi:ATP-dependent helicase Lhr and Lhr-like helicase